MHAEANNFHEGLEPPAPTHCCLYELWVASLGRQLLDQEQVMQQELTQP